MLYLSCLFMDRKTRNAIASKFMRLNELVQAERAMDREKHPKPELIGEIRDYIRQLEAMGYEDTERLEALKAEYP